MTFEAGRKIGRLEIVEELLEKYRSLTDKTLATWEVVAVLELMQRRENKG